MNSMAELISVINHFNSKEPQYDLSVEWIHNHVTLYSCGAKVDVGDVDYIFKKVIDIAYDAGYTFA
jgi:hypothetical protein